MFDFKVSHRYAVALFQIAQEQKAEKEVLNDLESLCNLIDSSDDFDMLVRSPVVSHSKKKRIFDEIFQDKLTKITYNFILLLAAKGRERLIKHIYTSYLKLYHDAKGFITIKIITASPLTDELKEKIIAHVHQITQRIVIPEYIIDKNVIGGVMINIDNWVYDSTIKNKLHMLKEQLVSDTQF